MNELPYVAEYSKSNRASCKTCKQTIAKDVLRVGIMVQSPHFDGKVPLWHHSKCFFSKGLAYKVEEIANYDNLKWEDQNCLKENIGVGSTNGKKKGAKGKTDFSVEYAKSSRAACRSCAEKLQKAQIRISKLIKDSPDALRFGPMPGWRHVDCFVKDRLELDFTDSADTLPGFKSLTEDDQKMLLEKIPKLGIKRKAEEKPQTVPTKKLAKEDQLLKAQSDLLFNMRDLIKTNLNKNEMITLLEYNDQHISVGEQNLRDHLSDCLVFGAVAKCPECKSDSPRFKVDAYRCGGNLTEWTKCLYSTKVPERKPFKIPKDFKEQYDFLKEYKYVQRERLFPKKEESTSAATSKGALSNYIFMLFGKFTVSKAVMENKVRDLGGLVASKLSKDVNCCISTEDEVAKNSKNVQKALNLDIHIVSPKFLDDVQNGATVAIAIKENCICNWGGDPILKFGIKQENKSVIKVKSKSSFTDPKKSSTMKVSVKGGAAVDPESGLESSCQVYQTKDNIYNAVLGVVDVAHDRNSFYKIQLLKANKKPKFYVFRCWGRVGTTIGGHVLNDFKNIDDAIKEFKHYYLDKTGNRWEDRKNFVKRPGLLYPLDIDYGQDFDGVKSDLKPGDNSMLSKPVQELICLIFDIEAMKKAMLEFEIDLKKMPLGKLSKTQIEKAYSVLTEAQEVLLTGSNATKILDVSNRFYTLIPHDFGMKKPTLLDNDELIKSKIEMLDSLLEIEYAFKLLQGDGAVSMQDPVDEHYEKLNADIDVLDESTDEFKKIETYLKNTHAETHRQYELILNKVFKINRHGESERYEKFKNLHNKKLLWHGSRLTNYVGILSQGLRIAPPEAPSTGYMFGKGIYFADMVSKSANYCFTTKKNNTGLLLLCEVALGDMWEKAYADYVTTLPKDKHSVLGCGMTVPDPKLKTYIGDVEIPYGKPVKGKMEHGALLYNEYIVYDVNQVNIKYLLDVKFKWRY